MSVPGILNNVLAFNSRSKITSDITNRELVRKVEELLEAQKKQTAPQRKTNPSKIMHLEFDDPEAKASVERKRKAILKAIEAIDAGQG